MRTHTPDVASLCAELDWNVSERSPGELLVDLELAIGFRQARVEAGPSGEVSASIDLLDEEIVSKPCRDAMALFLPRAERWLRGVRLVVPPDAGVGRARLEIVLPEEPEASDLDDALMALVTALRCCGEEAKALARDEALARTYLLTLIPTPTN